MSVQAGIWHYDGQPISNEQLANFERRTALHGPDAQSRFVDRNIALLYGGFAITNEDQREVQPLYSAGHTILTWDGRLDNRDELLRVLYGSPTELLTDVEIVSNALDTWGVDALPRLLGDWALAWWNPSDQRLLLSRDYIGIRKLYYLPSQNGLHWSTDLASLVLHGDACYSLCDNYFAGYFTSNADPHLTPYSEIKQVLPGGYVEITPQTVRSRRYWSFNSSPLVRYRSDSEYEECFRDLFRTAVKRRVRTAFPVLADLSGGLDSSSIVCMAHDISLKGETSVVMNTLSCYSRGEPGGDERPYFTAVEDFIGKRGTHIETLSLGTEVLQPLRAPYFAPLPGYFDLIIDGERLLFDKLGHQSNRVHLSGLGGDELLGGIQNPIPELASLLWDMRLPTFTQALQAWALQRKTTVWSLLYRTITSLAPMRISGRFDKAVVNWLRPEFVKRSRPSCASVPGDSWRAWLPGPSTPDSHYFALAGSIAGYLPRFTFPEQSAFPYYDRDLVQFLLAIPRDQVLRPAQRRSLMRRALKGIVPDIVLTRKTKWLGRRQPARQVLANAPNLTQLLRRSPIGEKYVDLETLQVDLTNLSQGKAIPTLLLERVLGACLLLQSLEDRALLREPPRPAIGLLSHSRA